MGQKRKFGAKEYFWILTLIVLITDIAVLLNIPFIRQIFGFLFLTILSGLLILQILKLNKIGFTEKVVLSVGLSISFLMFFGLLTNNLSLNLGYESPLSTISLLIMFNIAFIVLAIIGYKTNEDPLFSLPNLNLSTSEKAFLIIPILFPALSLFGMHIMNTTDNNIILMFMLFLISIYVIFVCLFNQKFQNRLYPSVIFLISISLLLLISLRSNHIMGVDTHAEHYFFQTTLNNLHWSVFGHSTLDACLSITLLPTVYQSILNIPSEFLFKILYSSIYSISPLVIYVISKRYIGESYAFLASCFFMFQFNFLITPMNARTNTAILFFALAMMTLFTEGIEPLKKRILFIVFMASCMVSHYSTTYVFFFVMVGTFIGMEILSKKYTFKKVVSPTIVILFFALIFFWYSQVTEVSFDKGVYYIEDTLRSLNRFFIAESRVESFEHLAGQKLPYPILSRASWVVTWCTFIFIGIGILTMLKRHKEMIVIDNIKLKKPDFLKEKFEVEYFMIALTCSGLLVAVVAVPYISLHYGIDRLYAIAITILSTFFVIGGITLSKYFFFFKKKICAKRKNNSFFGKAFFSKERFGEKNSSEVLAYIIILLILIPYFLFAAGVIHTTFGVPGTIILNSEGKTYDTLYVYDQESYGGKWLGEYKEKGIKLYSDAHGNLRLTSYAKVPDGSVDAVSLTENGTCNGYIYLRYYAVVNGKLLGCGGSYNLSECSHQFVGKNKIYANGGSEVYKYTM